MGSRSLGSLSFQKWRHYIMACFYIVFTSEELEEYHACPYRRKLSLWCFVLAGLSRTFWSSWLSNQCNWFLKLLSQKEKSPTNQTAIIAMQRCSRCCTRQFGSEEAARPSLSLTVTASLRHCVQQPLSSGCHLASQTRRSQIQPPRCLHSSPSSTPHFLSVLLSLSSEAHSRPPSHGSRQPSSHSSSPQCRAHPSFLLKDKNQIHSHVRYKNPSLFLFLRLFVCCFALLQDSFSAFFFFLLYFPYSLL